MRVAAEKPGAAAVLRRLESLFVGNVDAVFNVAYRVLWNTADAEDVVQQTFVKALTRLDQLRDSSRERPWLLRVAYREAIAVVRRRRELPTDPVDLPITIAADSCPLETAVAADIAGVVHRALEQMNKEERMAVVLRDVEDLPMRDVAEVLGIGLSAAKMRVHRGRSSLRQLLASKEVR